MYRAWASHCGCFSCEAQGSRGLSFCSRSACTQQLLSGARAGLSSCAARAQLPQRMWDLPSPGTEPVSPALAGRFLTTGPQGKPLNS